MCRVREAKKIPLPQPDGIGCTRINYMDFLQFTLVLGWSFLADRIKPQDLPLGSQLCDRMCVLSGCFNWVSMTKWLEQM